MPTPKSSRFGMVFLGTCFLIKLGNSLLSLSFYFLFVQILKVGWGCIYITLSDFSWVLTQSWVNDQLSILVLPSRESRKMQEVYTFLRGTSFPSFLLCFWIIIYICSNYCPFEICKIRFFSNYFDIYFGRNCFLHWARSDSGQIKTVYDNYLGLRFSGNIVPLCGC